MNQLSLSGSVSEDERRRNCCVSRDSRALIAASRAIERWRLWLIWPMAAKFIWKTMMIVAARIASAIMTSTREKPRERTGLMALLSRPHERLAARVDHRLGRDQHA